MFKCPCCDQNTLEETGVYEICDVCEWEDDPSLSKYPDETGANNLSLNDYKAERQVKNKQ